MKIHLATLGRHQPAVDARSQKRKDEGVSPRARGEEGYAPSTCATFWKRSIKTFIARSRAVRCFYAAKNSSLYIILY